MYNRSHQFKSVTTAFPKSGIGGIIKGIVATVYYKINSEVQPDCEDPGAIARSGFVTTRLKRYRRLTLERKQIIQDLADKGLEIHTRNDEDGPEVRYAHERRHRADMEWKANRARRRALIDAAATDAYTRAVGATEAEAKEALTKLIRVLEGI